MENKQIQTKPKKSKYNSIIEEMNRHIRIKKNIYSKEKDANKLFDQLILALRHLYKMPNKDVTQIGSKLMIDNHSYIITNYEKGKSFAISTHTKTGYQYNISYFIKKRLFSTKMFIKYYDHSIAPETIFGFKANIAKWWYKKQVRRNVKLIKNEIKLIDNKHAKPK